MARINNIVFVHQRFVDGSSWAGVYDILKNDGFHVSVVQNPTISLEGDVAATDLILDEQEGPAVLVGHSYGGVVITEAGMHTNVAALVYIAAFAPDKGESPIRSSASRRRLAAEERISLPRQGEDGGGVRRRCYPKTAVLADSQVPFAVDANDGAITEPAWREKPSWFLVATDDKMIPPPAQRQMSKRAGSTVVEVPGSHAIYVSNPRAVAALIEQAADSVKSAAK